MKFFKDVNGDTFAIDEPYSPRIVLKVWRRNLSIGFKSFKDISQLYFFS